MATAQELYSRQRQSFNAIHREGVQGFKASVNFTRPSDTTAYTIADAITNSTSAPVVLSYDLATFGATKGGFICVTNARVISSIAQGTLPQINVVIFPTTFTATNDNSALSVADATAITGGVIIPCLNTYTLGANSRCVSDSGMWVLQLADSSSTIYVTLQAANAYTPGNAEVFYVILEGYVL